MALDEIELRCPHCQQDVTVPKPWEALGEGFTCPECGRECDVEYDESYDPDSGNEEGWFWLAKPGASDG